VVDTLEIRAYNVRFGDATLLSIPERTNGGTTETRHVLIDFGNVLTGRGGDDAVFEPVLRDILAVLDGKPLDLFVMSHEHLDHVQGLEYCSKNLQLELPTRYVWLTASAAPDYYDSHPDARKKLEAARAALEEIEAFVAATPTVAPMFQGMLRVNNPRSTADCVDHLRALSAPEKPIYVYRGCDLQGKTPFTEAAVTILAPEEDTAGYYGRIQRMGLQPAAVTQGVAAERAPIPPPGVDAGSFYDLVGSRINGYADNLLTIDRAANNTSVVLQIEWRGYRLLFSGDAEQASWAMMSSLGLLQPVHFLKVGHHGSWNGSPRDALFEQVLPATPPDGRERFATISTCLETYDSVPDDDTVGAIAARCTLFDTRDVEDGSHVAVTFPAP
jgi:beta-lactamase superfamily II metal-dependent hydrolase